MSPALRRQIRNARSRRHGRFRFEHLDVRVDWRVCRRRGARREGDRHSLPRWGERLYLRRGDGEPPARLIVTRRSLGYRPALPTSSTTLTPSTAPARNRLPSWTSRHTGLTLGYRPREKRSRSRTRTFQSSSLPVSVPSSQAYRRRFTRLTRISPASIPRHISRIVSCGTWIVLSKELFSVSHLDTRLARFYRNPSQR